MSTKSSLCVRPAGKMDQGEKESIGSPIHVLVGQNEESALWKLAWGCPPCLGPASGGGGGSEPVCWLCGGSGGYRQNLAMGRYSCQSWQYV